jgi:hypothetical protein
MENIVPIFLHVKIPHCGKFVSPSQHLSHTVLMLSIYLLLNFQNLGCAISKLSTHKNTIYIFHTCVNISAFICWTVGAKPPRRPLPFSFTILYKVNSNYYNKTSAWDHWGGTSVQWLHSSHKLKLVFQAFPANSHRFQGKFWFLGCTLCIVFEVKYTAP